MYQSSSIRIIDCLYCKHFIGKLTGNDAPSCKAFKEGIPQNILAGDRKHTKPYKGDGGIQFEHKKR